MVARAAAFTADVARNGFGLRFLDGMLGTPWAFAGEFYPSNRWSRISGFILVTYRTIVTCSSSGPSAKAGK
jgi:hypothetical protein